jgi:hypothetical protein
MCGDAAGCRKEGCGPPRPRRWASRSSKVAVYELEKTPEPLPASARLPQSETTLLAGRGSRSERVVIEARWPRSGDLDLAPLPVHGHSGHLGGRLVVTRARGVPEAAADSPAEIAAMPLAPLVAPHFARHFARTNETQTCPTGTSQLRGRS